MGSAELRSPLSAFCLDMTVNNLLSGNLRRHFIFKTENDSTITRWHFGHSDKLTNQTLRPCFRKPLMHRVSDVLQRRHGPELALAASRPKELPSMR